MIVLLCFMSFNAVRMKSLYLLIILLFAGQAYGQESMDKDSLLRLLPTTGQDSNRVLLLIQIGQQFEGSEPEISKQYYLQARDLSKKIGYRLGEIKFAANFTYLLNMQGFYDSALQINLESVRLAKAINNKEYIAKTLFNAGTSYRLLEDYETALRMYQEGSSVYQVLDNAEMAGLGLDIIQGLYTQLRQYRRAIGYGTQAVELLRKRDNPVVLAITLGNLGMNYSLLRIFDSALLCYNESLRLGQMANDKYVQASAYLGIADVYMNTLDYHRIEPYMTRALALAKELKSYASAVIAYRGLSYYYSSRKDYSRARLYADSSLALAQEQGLKAEMQKTYAQLSKLSFAQQNYLEGERYSILSTEIGDSIFNESVLKRTSELDKKYETTLKDNQIKLQQASIRATTTWNYVLVGGVVVLLLMSLLTYRNYRHRQKIQQQRINELETEKQLVATEAVLKGEEQERTRLAQDLHDGLGGMLSGIKYSFNTMKENLVMTPDNAQAFERGMDLLDSSIREMRRVAHNMMPEALVKFGLDTALRDFCEDVNRSGVLKVTYQSIGLQGAEPDQTRAITIYRIVQELLNNTIKHAAATSALVQVSRDENQLSVTVEDDGKGFDTAVLQKSKGMGWYNIQNRIDFLKGHWDVDSQAGKGTSVHIEITL